MIRWYRDGDMDGVAAVWLQASVQAFDFIGREYWEAKERDMRELYLPLCSDIVVHEDGGTGRIDGFLAFADDYLAALFVAPYCQGQGIGSQLLRLAKKMRPQFSLTVYAKNTRAVAFYRRAGLALDGERTERETGERELILTWGRGEMAGCEVYP